MKNVLVWDWPIRMLHWLMVVLFSALIVTGKSEEDYLELHINLGYALSGVLVARILYGFLGSYHGKFYHAFFRLKEVFKYSNRLLNRTANPELGHNPLGWLMVIMMIGLLTFQIVSGLFSTDDIFWYGPFYDYATDEWISLFSYFHQILPNTLIALSVLHIGAVLIHEICFKERLIRAMVFGKKQVRTDTPGPVISTPRWGITISLIVSLCWLTWLFTLPN